MERQMSEADNHNATAEFEQMLTQLRASLASLSDEPHNPR
jgi:hypothetical protein